MPSAVAFNADGEDYYRNTWGLSSPCSYTVWVKVSGARAYAGAIQLDNGSTTAGLHLQCTADGLSWMLGTHTGVTQTIRAVQVGTWVAFGVVQTSATAYTVYHGTDPNSLTTTSVTLATGGLTTYSHLQMAETRWTNEWLNGSLAAVKFWSVALTGTEVAAELKQYDPVRVTNLFSTYLFSSGPSTTDNSGNARTLSGGVGASTDASGPPIPLTSAGSHTGSAALTSNPLLSASTMSFHDATSALTSNPGLSATAVRTTSGSAGLVSNPSLAIVPPDPIRTTFGSASLVSAPHLNSEAVAQSPSVAVGIARGVTIHLLNADGSYRCPLPDYSNLAVSRDAGSPGAISFSYARVGTNFAALREFVDQKKQVEVVLWISGSVKHQLYGYLDEAQVNNVDEDQIWDFSGNLIPKRLDEGILYPVAGTEDGGGETVYSGDTPGQIILHAIGLMKGRGTLTEILTTSFTATTDSEGTNWPTSVSVSFSPGTKLSDVLNELRDQGLLEYEIKVLSTGVKHLRLYVPTNWGVDRTLNNPPLILTSYKSIVSSPRKYSAKNMATHLLLVGAEGLNATSPNAAAFAKLGRRIETHQSSGSLKTQSSVNAYASAKSALIGDPNLEVTHELNLHEIAPMPLEDFDLGDWIYSDTPHSPSVEKLQVVQWTLSASAANELQSTVSLNSMFYNNALATKRRIDRMINGTVVVGTSKPTPGVLGDTVAPKAPTNIILDSIAWQHSNSGVVETAVEATISWTMPTQNVDNTAYTDHSYTRVRYAYLNRFQVGGLPSSNPFNLPEVFTYPFPDGVVTSNTCALNDLTPGADIGVQVQAVDSDGYESEWSIRYDFTVANDETPPPKPSTPVITPWFRTFNIYWDGYAASTALMMNAAPDFERMAVHIDVVNNFTPSEANLKEFIYATDGQGETNVVLPDYATNYFVRFVAYDRSGNASVPSDTATAATLRGVADDIGNGIITAAKIADNQPLGPKISPEQIQTGHISIANFSDNQIPNGGFEDPGLPGEPYPSYPAKWDPDVTNGTVSRETTAANVQSGGASLKLSLTNATQKLSVVSAIIPTLAGDNWYFEFNVKASRALNGFQVLLGVSDDLNAPDTYINILGGAQALTTSYTDVSANYTVPATVGAGVVPKYIRLYIAGGQVPADTNPVDIWVDSVRGRKTVGTAEIQDLAVSRAKIGLLAVGAANVEFVNAGSIVSGTVTATLTNSGMFRTASSGNRVEFDGAGIRLYQNTTVVGRWQTSDASMLMTGTYQSALSGERINILPDGSMRFYPAAGSNYSSINNLGNDLMIRGVQDANGRSGRINANITGVGLNFSNEGEIPSNLRSEVVLFDRVVRITSPIININLNGKLAPNGGGPRRVAFFETASNGATVDNSLIEYKLHADGWGAFVGITSNVGWLAQNGSFNIVNSAINGFMPISATAFNVASATVLKEDIEPLETVLDAKQTLFQMKPRKYKLKSEKWHTPAPTADNPNPEPVPCDAPIRFGFLAEEMPEILSPTIPSPDNNGTIKGHDLGHSVAVLWSMVQYLVEKIDAIAEGVSTEPVAPDTGGVLFSQGNQLKWKNAAGEVKVIG